MSNFFKNRALAAVLAAAMLAGCEASAPTGSPAVEPVAETPDTEATLSAESLVMAETAWLSITDEGEVFTTYLDPDGRYRDERSGELIYSGTWKQNSDGELCFAPDAGSGSCWSHGSPGLDGVMRATDRQGREIEVRRVAYAPPSTPVQDEQSSEEPGASMNGDTATRE